MSKKIKTTSGGSITTSTYSMMNAKNPKTDSGSLFIRSFPQTTNKYWISYCAGNLMGIGCGLVLEIRPVPDKQTRYFNCLWVEKVSLCEDPYMTYAGIHNTKKPGTEPFYVVSRKPNKSLEKELARFVDRMDETDDFNDCQIIDAQDFLRRFLDYVRV